MCMCVNARKWMCACVTSQADYIHLLNVHYQSVIVRIFSLEKTRFVGNIASSNFRVFQFVDFLSCKDNNRLNSQQ